MFKESIAPETTLFYLGLTRGVVMFDASHCCGNETIHLSCGAVVEVWRLKLADLQDRVCWGVATRAFAWT